MSLTRTATPLGLLVDVLNEHLPQGWTAGDEGDPAAGTIVVEPVTTPDPTGPTLGGLPEHARALFQVTAHASTRRKARLIGDEVRDILTGRTGRQPTFPLEADGFTFQPVRTGGDGRVLLSSGVHTYVETYSVEWQYREPYGS